MKRYIVLFLLAMPFSSVLEAKKFWGLDQIINFFSNAVDSSEEIARNLVKSAYPVSKPYGSVYVQTSSELSPEEKRFMHNRTMKVQHVLSEEFDIQNNLRIGICCSGGGNRAMVGTTGFLLGAAKSKVLDATMYLSGLSGSTWSIVPFSYLATTEYKHESFEVILEAMKHSYFDRLNDCSMIGIGGVYSPPLVSFDSSDDILTEASKRFAYDQPVTLVNLFGALVGDYALDLMGADRLSTFWSTISAESQLGDIPLPLCSAIFNTRPHSGYYNYEWFEMSPLQAGSSVLGYIPVEYLGSKFNQGVLDFDKICPEYPLYFYMGMYGSAFSATIHDIETVQRSLGLPVSIMKDACYQNVSKRNFLLQNSIVTDIAKSIINDAMQTRNPLTYAQLDNYSYGLSGSIMSEHEMLGVFDAGIDFNLPIPVFVDRNERAMDIVILYDSNPADLSLFHEISNYCLRKGVSFPDYSNVVDSLQSKTMTVLNDPRSWNYDASVSTYLYFPSNNIDVTEPPYITFNFKYEEQDVQFLTDSMEQAFLSQVDEIKEIMKLVAEKKAQ